MLPTRFIGRNTGPIGAVIYFNSFRLQCSCQVSRRTSRVLIIVTIGLLALTIPLFQMLHSADINRSVSPFRLISQFLLHYFLKQGSAAWPGFLISQMCGFIPPHREIEKSWNSKVDRRQEKMREEQELYRCIVCGHGLDVNECRGHQLSVCVPIVSWLTSQLWFLAGWWVFL